MAVLIPILLLLPVVGAIACAFMRSGKNAKHLALVVSLACFGLTLPLLFGFDWNAPQDVQFYTEMFDASSNSSVLAEGHAFPDLRAVTSAFAMRFGVDSISLWLVALTTFLQPLAVAASFASIKEREKEYYAWMLALLTAMLGVFVARDALLFYVFFELTLVPMFFIIGIWGGSKRREAAGKFFLFTFAGSVFTLAALVYAYVKMAQMSAQPSFELNNLISFIQSGLTPTEKFWVLLGFLAGFAVKVPLFPVHTWLPLAHTEAPTAGSVILAGVLLKLGTYGILRLALPAGMVSVDYAQTIYSFNLIYGWEFTRIAISFAGVLKFIGVLCVIGIIYGALVAWVQQDIKKLVAYSSVSHLGFCVLGLVALNHEGIQGSILYMINHGLSTGALFLVIGMIYDRYHTRDINQLSGLARKMPVLAFFFILFTLSSIGLPGLNGFASEFLTILAAFRSPHLGIGYGAFAALGIILGAIYMLHMAARVIWGPLKTPGHEDHGHGAHGHGHSQADQGQAASPGHDDKHDVTLPTDIGKREIAILIPLAIAVIVLGVIPGKLLRTLEAPVSVLVGEPKSPVLEHNRTATVGTETNVAAAR